MKKAWTNHRLVHFEHSRAGKNVIWLFCSKSLAFGKQLLFFIWLFFKAKGGGGGGQRLQDKFMSLQIKAAHGDCLQCLSLVLSFKSGRHTLGLLKRILA